MDTITKIFVMFLTVASIAITPALISYKSASAVDSSSKGWCESQSNNKNRIQGCKDGWFDHDKCIGESTYAGDYGKGYKVGWNHGSCKK